MRLPTVTSAMRSAASTASADRALGLLEIDDDAGLDAARARGGEAEHLDRMRAPAQRLAVARLQPGDQAADLGRADVEDADGHGAARAERLHARHAGRSVGVCALSRPRLALALGVAPSEVTSSSERPSGRRTVTRSGRRRSMTTTSRARSWLLGVELDQLRERLADALLRQLDGDAVVEMQVPAAAGDEHRGAHLRRRCRARVRRSARKVCAVSLAPPPTMKGSLAKRDSSSGTISRAGLVDDEDFAVALPEREGLALGDLDRERAGIEFPHA